MNLLTYKLLIKLTVLVCCSMLMYLVIICLVGLYDLLRHLGKLGHSSTFSITDLKHCGSNVATEVIVPVKNSKAFLVSAYLDERFSPRMIRIISIVDRASWTQFYCHFCNSSKAISTTAEVAFHPEHFGFPYGTADILCQVPWEAGVVSSVSVTTGLEPYPGSPFLPIRSLKRVSSAAFHRNFTVCISTLFGNYSNVLQLVQSLEMYRILGAQKVLIYKSDCSSMLQKVLDYYSSEGLVEVIAWNIHHHLNVSKSWRPSLDPGDVHYYGQITALNDCVYRNMAISRYVVLNDIDEVVVPVLHNNWVNMMSHLSMGHLGTESFFFENSVFRYRDVGDDGKFDLWPHVPGVNILRHVRREPFRFLAFNAQKMIVNPRAVVRISVHKVPWQMGARLQVPSSVARLQHCRNVDDWSVKDSELIRDTSLWKYSTALIKNVNRVISHILKS